MAKLIATIKAIITRLIFGAHGFIAIWQVTQFKKNPFYWYLSVPMLLLFFEGIFTLTIKENQEWKWFCPSVFLYLGSVVPAIWLLELDKVDRRLKAKEESFNLTASTDLKELQNIIGVQIKLPDIPLSTEMWVTLIEQFLMLILIIGRWMLPKGDLSRDQLSQLLLVYIGTAADIIEFFDSFKDDKIASEPILVILTLAIWSWSLMQFTVVLTATKSRKSRLSASGTATKPTQSGCCNIDVWGIALNITLQDAPFLVFRLLIIIHFNIISYMNVFFTCKNTLVIMLQLYRLYVVHSESRKKPKKKKDLKTPDFELTNISIIAKPDMYGGKHNLISDKKRGKKIGDKSVGNVRNFPDETECSSEIDEMLEYEARKYKKLRKLQNARKDTGYSTGSSHTSCTRTPLSTDEKRHYTVTNNKTKNPTRSRDSSREPKCKKNYDLDEDSLEMRIKREKQRRRKQKQLKQKEKEEGILSEESLSEEEEKDDEELEDVELEILKEKKNKKSKIYKDVEKNVKSKKSKKYSSSEQSSE